MTFALDGEFGAYLNFKGSNMLQRALDKRWVRVTFAILFGLPGVLLAVFSIGLGTWLSSRISGLSDWYALVLVPLALLLTLGVVGIWRRILKPHSVMTGQERARVRAFLLIGILGIAGYAVFTVILFEEAFLVPFFTVLAGITLLFIFATPNSK